MTANKTRTIAQMIQHPLSIAFLFTVAMNFSATSFSFAQEKDSKDENDGVSTVVVKVDRPDEIIRMFTDLYRTLPEQIPAMTPLPDRPGIVVSGRGSTIDRLIDFVDLVSKLRDDGDRSLQWIALPDGIQFTPDRRAMLEILLGPSPSCQMMVEGNSLALYGSTADAETAKRYFGDLKESLGQRSVPSGWTVQLDVLGPTSMAPSADDATLTSKPSDAVVRAAKKLGLDDPVVLGGLFLTTRPTSKNFRGRSSLGTTLPAFLEVDGAWIENAAEPSPVLSLILSVEATAKVGERVTQAGREPILKSDEVLELSAELVPVENKTLVIGRGGTPDGTLVFVLRMNRGNEVVDPK